MEVYEKSLKRAQRGLLRKAEWGEAIQPQPQVKHYTSILNQMILQATSQLSVYNIYIYC